MSEIRCLLLVSLFPAPSVGRADVPIPLKCRVRIMPAERCGCFPGPSRRGLSWPDATPHSVWPRRCSTGSARGACSPSPHQLGLPLERWSAVVYTHSHWDHVLGGAELGGLVIAQAATAEQLVELAIGEILLAAPALVVQVVHHAQLEIVDGEITLAARAPSRVVRLEHLVEVLGFQRLPGLGDLARASQPQLLHTRARVVPAEQPDPEDQRNQAAQQHERERVHRRAV